MSHGGDTVLPSIFWRRWNLLWTVVKLHNSITSAYNALRHLIIHFGLSDEVNILLLGAAEGRNIFEALASTRPASESFKKLTLR